MQKGRRTRKCAVLAVSLCMLLATGCETKDKLVLYNMSSSEFVNGQEVDIEGGYREQHEMDLLYIQEGTATYDKVLEEIESGSDKYDIYMVSSSMGDSTRCKEKQLYYDLSDSEIIIETVKNMYRSVSKTAWNGGELFGLPMGVMGEILCYNPENYPQYDEESYATWDSVLNIIEENDWNNIYRLMNGRVYFAILEQYLATHIDSETGRCDFDTPEFRRMVSGFDWEMDKYELLSLIQRHFNGDMTEDELVKAVTDVTERR